MVKPSRRNVAPILVRALDTVAEDLVPLERVNYGERDLREGWLQDLVYRQPTLLAVEEIEPDYGPLIPLGREIGTDVGPIDGLFVSPDGLITLVEAKLWRNPQARREVVGQILDYAKQLSSWSYEDLDHRVQALRGCSIWDLIQTSGGSDQLEEDEFIDAVARNLRRGRFLLLIVGDGIRESVEELADFLQGAPDMRFTLALVELGIYRAVGGQDLLVVPAIVARTREVVRAVVEVTSLDAVQRVRALEPAAKPLQRESNSTRRETVDDEAYFATMLDTAGPRAVRWVQELLAEAERRDLRVESKAASKMVRLKDPGGSGKDFTLFGVHQRGELFIGWLGRQTVAAGYPFEASPAQRYIACMSALFGKEPVAADRPQAEFWKPPASLTEVSVAVSDVLTCLDAFLDEMSSRQDG